MKKLLLFLLLVAVNIVLKAQNINETFEAGTTPLGWVAADKAKYLGVVNNPDTNKVSINKSAKCAGFVKDSTTAYSYAFVKLAKPLNLTGNSKFKIQLFSKAGRSTKFIFKFEGGKTQEFTKITAGSVNRWEELSFDFKAVDTVTVFNQITIFFDATNGTSKDTFYFDNLVQVANDACSGVTPPTTQNLYDDFECQRNAAITNYSGALDSLTIIDNPDKTGINTSAKVAKYVDAVGSGTEYAGIIYDNIDPIALNKFPILRVKVWSAKAGKHLFKLEGGPTAKEVFVNINADQTSKWVELIADYSSAVASNNSRLVMFFNVGNPGVAGDIFYIDDVRFTATLPAFEDFEPQKITWTPLNNDAALHGAFAVTANPALSSAINSSANVGKYTKGTAVVSTLTGALNNFIVTVDAPQLNMQVYSPDSGKVVRIQLVSAATGTIDVSATTTTKNAWENLVFDFSKAVGVTDISKVNILFDPATAASGKIYYFDNLYPSKSTVDVCSKVVANPNILDDFECQRNYTIDVPGPIKAIPNPKSGNANNSDKVGEYTDPFDQYSALTYTFPKAIDLSKYNQFSVKIWAPKVVPLLFKLEGGAKGLTKEFPATVTKSGDWVTYTTDMSSEKGKDYTKISIFFNLGIVPTSTDIYYVDDIVLKSEPINGCLTNFEQPINFSYFATKNALDGKPLTIVPNPKKTAIDSSANVLKFVRFAGSEPFQGASYQLEAPMKWTNAKYVLRSKVYMDHVGNLGLKLEAGDLGLNLATVPHEKAVANTKVNDWEDISIDLSNTVLSGEIFSRFTLFIDLNLPVGTTDVTSYLDDLVIGDGAGCAATKVGTNDVAISQLGFAPNPATNEIYVRNLQNVRRLDVTNVWGQVVRTISLTNIGSFDIQTIPLDGLSAGMYIVSGYDEKGMIANGKFVKE